MGYHRPVGSFNRGKQGEFHERVYFGPRLRRGQRRRPPSKAGLRVGGFAPFSSCDWPGELVATVFCQGCPWNCGYPEPRAEGAGQGAIGWAEVMRRLGERVGLLDGVVFSGGEPTAQAGLAAAMRAVRGLGFRIGLHTAGPSPERLQRVLGLVDWIGFDAKAPFARYAEITGVPGSGRAALASLRRVLAAGVECEVRTTIHPALLDEAAVAALADELAGLGVKTFAVQPFRATGCDPGFVARHGNPPPRLPEGLARRFPTFIDRIGWVGGD